MSDAVAIATATTSRQSAAGVGRYCAMWLFAPLYPPANIPGRVALGAGVPYAGFQTNVTVAFEGTS
jgi:hypothetical protein